MLLNNFLKNGNFNFIKSNKRKYKRTKKVAPRRSYVATAMEQTYNTEGVSSPVLDTLNNLKVVVQNKPDASLLTIGITVQCGSVNETDNNSGIGRFIADCALEGPSSRGNFNLRTEIRNLGAQINVQVDRENTTYIARCFPQDVDAVMGVLGDIVKNRDFDQRVFDGIVSATSKQYDEVLNNRDIMMDDHLHAAAFQGTNLERSTYVTDQSLPNLNTTNLTKHMDTYYTAPSIVLSAVGPVNRDKILAAAGKAFDGIPQTGARLASKKVDFVGSEVRIRDDDINGLHVIYSLQGVSNTSEYKEGYMLLKELLGSYDSTYGGLNNNASHLSEALLEERLVNNYHSFQNFYNDIGVIGVKGFFTTNTELDLDISSDFVLKEFQRIGKTMSEADLQRAKNVVISQALHNWNDDYTLAKDIGLQAFKGVNSLSETINRIQRVTTSDMKNITLQLDDSCPVIVSYGKTEDFPDYTVLRNRTFWTLW